MSPTFLTPVFAAAFSTGPPADPAPAGLGEVHAAAGLAIGLASLVIPLLLLRPARRTLPVLPLSGLLALFIAAAGISHLLDAVVGADWPAGAVKLVAAGSAWAAVVALVLIRPPHLMPARDLTDEVTARTAQLAEANTALEREGAERGRAERELVHQREWFRVVLASIGDGVIATDDRHRVAFMNPAAERLTGWAAADAAGRPLDEVVHTLDEGTRARLESPAARVLREGTEVGLANHTILTARGGAERIIERSAAPIRDDAGKVLGVVLAVRDTTEHKRAEVVRARLAALVEGTDDAIIGEDLDGTVQTWNPGAERLYGWAAADIIGQPIKVLVPPEKWDELAGLTARAARGERVPTFETVRVTNDGRRVHVSVTLSPIRGAGGAVIGVSKIVRDIGRQKQSADALRVQGERLRLNGRLLNLSHAMVRGTDGRIETWTDGMARLYGWTRAEAEGRVSHDLLRTRFPAPFQEISETFARTGQWEGELAHSRADGTEITVISQWVVDRAEDGRVRVLEVNHDITRLKRAEEAAAGGLAQLRAVVASMTDGLVIADSDGNLLEWNPAALQLHGFDSMDDVRRNLSTFAAMFELSLPDGPPLPLGDWPLSRILRGETITDYELKVRRLDRGTELFISFGGRLVPGPAGRPGLALVTLHDVSGRRAAAEALRHSEARFRHLADAMPQIVWSARPDGTVDYFNRRWYELAAGEEGLPAQESWLRVIHPDDRQKCLDLWDRAVRAGTLYQIEYRFQFRDADEYRWYLGRAVPVRDDAGRIVRWFGKCTDIHDHKRAEADLVLRDRAIQAATQGILITDSTRPDNPIVYASPGFERMTGYAVAEVTGSNCRFLQGPLTDPTPIAALREAVAAGRPCSVEMLNYRKDGSLFWNALSVTPVRDGDRVTHFVGVQTDVTDRRRLEDQFRQAQKMEAVGQLAGGVAHDFNNLLTVINGYSHLMLDDLPAEDPNRPALTAIREAGERAAGLTSQLLAFSRQTVLEPRVVDPNAVVAETGKMLRRLIGEDVSLGLGLADQVRRVLVDPGQFGQVLMNLAVNARDAMPTGGQLTIETRDVDLDRAYAGLRPDVRPGAYVLIGVSDTGTGMPPDVQARVFEPFFTTKASHQGTGLGLATVYGIVKQSGGHIEVYSEVGHGTTFKIYLPAAEGEGGPGPDATPVGVPGGTETVLVVEDQDEVRGFAAVALQAYGYTVVQASDGPTALRMIDRDRPAIDLLVTDVVMPGMSGRLLAERVRGVYPDLAVLFVSGYTDDAVVRHGILQAEVAFLRKPYTPLSLAQKVREVLDAAR